MWLILNGNRIVNTAQIQLVSLGTHPQNAPTNPPGLSIVYYQLAGKSVIGESFDTPDDAETRFVQIACLLQAING